MIEAELECQGLSLAEMPCSTEPLLLQLEFHVQITFGL